jgi:predicted alpha/beta hydrolase
MPQRPLRALWAAAHLERQETTIEPAEPSEGFSVAVAKYRERAEAEPDGANKTALLESASALQKLDLLSRQIAAEAAEAKARAKALEPSPLRLVAHFVLVATVCLLVAYGVLRASLKAWGMTGQASMALQLVGVLVGALLSVWGAYCASKVFASQSERLRFTARLPRWLAPARPSLLVSIYALVLFVAFALARASLVS